MAIPLRQTKLMGKGPLKVLHNGMKIYTNIEISETCMPIFLFSGVALQAARSHYVITYFVL